MRSLFLKMNLTGANYEIFYSFCFCSVFWGILSRPVTTIKLFMVHIKGLKKNGIQEVVSSR